MKRHFLVSYLARVSLSLTLFFGAPSMAELSKLPPQAAELLIAPLTGAMEEVLKARPELSRMESFEKLVEAESRQRAVAEEIADLEQYIAFIRSISMFSRPSAWTSISTGANPSY